MEKQFIPYTLALALKELGFDGDCFAIWSGFDEINFSTTDKVRLYSSKFRINDTQSATFYINDFNSLSSRVAAPTFSQAFRWFRDKYNIEASVRPVPKFDIDKSREVVFYIDGVFISNLRFTTDKSYEEAELECLKKLIEIVKNKL